MTDRNPLIQLMMVDDNEDDQILFRNAFSRSVHFRIGELAVDGEQALEKLGRVSNRVGSSPPGTCAVGYQSAEAGWVSNPLGIEEGPLSSIDSGGHTLDKFKARGCSTRA